MKFRSSSSIVWSRRHASPSERERREDEKRQKQLQKALEFGQQSPHKRSNTFGTWILHDDDKATASREPTHFEFEFFEDSPSLSQWEWKSFPRIVQDKNWRKLCKLTYNGNITNSACQALAMTVSGSSVLETLDLHVLLLLGAARPCAGEFTKLCEAIGESQTLKHLKLDAWLDYSSELVYWQSLAGILRKNKSLVSMDLFESVSRFNEHDLAQALAGNTVLKYLSLPLQSDAGFLTLESALRTNTTLSTLSLKGQQIEVEGCQALALALSANNSITELQLDFVHACSEGWKILLEEGLGGNQSIKSVTLAFGWLPEGVPLSQFRRSVIPGDWMGFSKSLGKILLGKSSIESIDMSSSNFSGAEYRDYFLSGYALVVQSISFALQSNYTLLNVEHPPCYMRPGYAWFGSHKRPGGLRAAAHLLLNKARRKIRSNFDTHATITREDWVDAVITCRNNADALFLLLLESPGQCL